MKKEYINPAIDVAEFEDEMIIATSETMTIYKTETVDGADALSKERESVNFSDSESIW